MRKMTLLLVLFAAATPVGALAAKPPHPSTPASTNTKSDATTGKAKGSSAEVLFVLHGTIMGYTAGKSVSIKVSASNLEPKTLKAMTLTFPLDSKTKVTGTVKTSDAGIVKLHAPKNAAPTALQALSAFQLIDQHASA